MKISIISPSYNQSAFIQKTIESVASQDYANKEHIIVDGGSTDGSVELIRAAVSQHPHITAVIEPDDGQADAINKGFRRASGEILAWLNTDDYYKDPGALTSVAEFFSSQPDVDVLWGRGIRVDSAGKKLNEAWIQKPQTDFNIALQHSLGILQPSVFFQRSVFETVGGLRIEYPLQLDYEYWIRIAAAGFQFGFLDKVLSCAVVHADAKSTAQRMSQLSECLGLIKEKFQYVPIQWIRRFAEFRLTRQDQKVTKVTNRLKLNDAQKVECSLVERALLKLYNVNEDTRTMIQSNSNSEPYAETWRAMQSHHLDSPRPRRVIITSFDSAYYRQGLNLIAALHRSSLSSFDEVHVYSLQLSQTERERLDSLDKVKVIDYPDEVKTFFPEYLEPKTRAYKPCAIRGSNSHLHEGDLVLWLDTGLAPLQDIGQIFDIIAEDEFFITNHDDKDSWPFFNINFAHRESHIPLGLSNSDLLGQHHCSALIGYKNGGKYQQIVEEAYRLGQIREAVVWDKCPSETEKHKPVLSNEQHKLRDKLAKAEINPEEVSYETLISIFEYWGHRTQILYSVLSHRFKTPVFSAKKYRRSSEKSSQAAIVNWAESALKTDSLSSRLTMDGIDSSVVVYHHRGIYNNLDGLRFKRGGDSVFVVGNGPSLREFPFEALQGKPWIGMNAAYRYWEKVQVYPTYYSCFDDVVLESHRVEIANMIENRVSLGISKFFLRRKVLEHYPHLEENSAVYFLEDLQRDVDWFSRDKITTGSFSVLAGWFLGYRDIYLLGVDLNYTELLPETVVEGRTLVLSADPKSNPNYFFEGYQRKGDRYNPPNRHPGLHLRSWAQLRSITQDFPMTITNLNPDSAVKDFPFEDYRNVLKRLESLPEQIADLEVQTYQEQHYWREQTISHLSKSVDSTTIKPTPTESIPNSKRKSSVPLSEENHTSQPSQSQLDQNPDKEPSRAVKETFDTMPNTISTTTTPETNNPVKIRRWFGGYVRRNPISALSVAIVIGIIGTAISLFPDFRNLSIALMLSTLGSVACVTFVDYIYHVFKKCHSQIGIEIASVRKDVHEHFIAYSKAAQKTYALATRLESLKTETKQTLSQQHSLLKAELTELIEAQANRAETQIKNTTAKADKIRDALATDLKQLRDETLQTLNTSNDKMLTLLSELRTEVDDRIAQKHASLEDSLHDLESESKEDRRELSSRMGELQAEVDEKCATLEESLRNLETETKEDRRELSSRMREVQTGVNEKGATLEESLRHLESETREDRRELSRRIGELQIGIDEKRATFEKSLRNLESETKEDQQDLSRRIGELQTEILETLDQRYKELTDGTSKQLSKLRNSVTDQQANLDSTLHTIRDEFARADAATATRFGKELEKNKSPDLSQEISVLRNEAKRLATGFQYLNASNAASARPHQRLLSPADIMRMKKHWARLFGLTVTDRSLSYLAHQICLLEDRAIGRLATTISAAVLRLLALRSITDPKVNVLEIGTLFGISAGILSRLGRELDKKIHITIIDPLDGYYGKSVVDPPTGISVDKQTLERNLRTMEVRKPYYRIIKKSSHDPSTVKEAASKTYEYVLLDGDHSYDGVAKDFELYGPLVKPGGLLVFDDYDTDDWPAIKAFVDNVVLKDPSWEWLGGEWRTGIFRRRSSQSETTNGKS